MPLTPAAEAPIFLIGFMGSGKTTVGRLLAKLTKREFVDLDHWIEQKEHRKISEIFAQEGESKFRLHEAEALKTLSREKWTVVATGGGAACQEGNLKLMLQTGHVVTLLVSAAEAMRRTGAHSGRPLLDGKEDPMGAAQALLAKRQSYYERAPLRVTTDHQSPETIASKIVSDLGPGVVRSKA